MNLYYPQLSSGAIAQYPAARRLDTRTLVNGADDASYFALADPGAMRMYWRIAYSGLSEAEKNAIETLFASVSGRYESFVFLDPFANLLRFSEDLTNAVWEGAALLDVVTGTADPNGSTGAVTLTNASQSAAQIMQPVAGPASYQYTVSAYVHAGAAQTVGLVAAAGATSSVQTFAVNSAWTRVQYTAALNIAAGGVSFGLQLQPGACVDVFGLQVEAQPNAGPYKRTLAAGGVFRKARFEQDTLAVRAQAPGLYSATVEISASE